MLGKGNGLVGDQLSLADLAEYAMFQCFRDADNANEILQRYPAVTEWMGRIEALTSEHAA
jgi:glutathione S-transferase